MSKFNENDQVLALAGIFQAAALVRKLARSGQEGGPALDASLGSLFQFNAPDTAAVFGGVAGVASGLRTLVNQLENTGERDMEIAQYVISVIHLADQLRRDANALNQLGDDLSRLAERSDEFALSRSTRIAQIEGIYQQHISERNPRILVKGEPVYLQNPDTAAQVRALLLAGIRAAVLWRQTGGRKWQLILRRKRIAELARNSLE